ncbi:MAG: hypothetical protein NTV75_08880 [Bacteroidia bacterium]|nr:hypothetical protein [Bacteroidia bacterium]
MKRSLVLLVFALLSSSLQLIAQGDLLITPRRVVFEGNNQREELSLVNTGKDTTTYSISFVEKNMKDDGSFISLDKKSNQKMSAEPYLRIFPRTVTLAPGEPQVIMLQCRRTPNMVAGEYRSHLYFRSEKDYSPLGSKNPFKDTTLVSVQLIPIFGISIPVIVRTGTFNVASTFTNLRLSVVNDTIPTLDFTINRAGNCSTYGDLVVEYSSGKNKPIAVGLIKGVGVYTNLDHRNVSVKLNQVKGVVLKAGNLKVRYTTPDDAKYMVYAEKEARVEDLQRANLAVTTIK